MLVIPDPTTGVITMNPSLDQWNENLNYEAADPNPVPLALLLVDAGAPSRNSTVRIYIRVVNGPCVPVLRGLHVVVTSLRVCVRACTWQETMRPSRRLWSRQHWRWMKPTVSSTSWMWCK